MINHGKRKDLRTIKKELFEILGYSKSNYELRIAVYTSIDVYIVSDLEVQIYAKDTNNYIDSVNIAFIEDEDTTNSVREFWDKVELHRNMLAYDKKYVFNKLKADYNVILADDFTQ